MVSLGCLFMFCAAVQAADPTPLNGEAAMSLTPSVTKGPVIMIKAPANGPPASWFAVSPT
jgi:hypothetical protein